MGAVSPWHLAILAVVVIALFGAKRLPETARGLGQSMKIFKSELRGDAPDASAAALPADSAPAQHTPVQHTTTPGQPTDSAPPAQH